MEELLFTYKLKGEFNGTVAARNLILTSNAIYELEEDMHYQKDKSWSYENFSKVMKK